MYCNQCGAPLSAESKFCAQCGTATATSDAAEPNLAKNSGSKALLITLAGLAVVGTGIALALQLSSDSANNTTSNSANNDDRGGSGDDSQSYAEPVPEKDFGGTPDGEITDVGHNPDWQSTPNSEDYSFATVRLTTGGTESCEYPVISVNFYSDGDELYDTVWEYAAPMEPNSEQVIDVISWFEPSNNFAEYAEVDVRCE